MANLSKASNVVQEKYTLSRSARLRGGPLGLLLLSAMLARD